MHRRNESNYSNVSTTVPPNGPDGTWQQRKSAERLYSLIRTSNPWNDDDVFGPEPTHNGKSSQISDRSGMMQIEVKPSPLDTPFSVNPKPRPDPSELNPSEPTTHRPSYEGTAFGSTPLPTLKEMKSTERVRQTRIPSPITIPPYETSRKYHPLVERAVSLAETSPVSSEPPPIVPLKDPKRWSSPHGHVQRSHSVQLAHEECSPGPRIVSKENIRAALGDLSRETSAESLREDDVRGGGIRKTSNGSVGDKHAFARMGGRGLNTGESLAFPTFNTHMFPRNQTPARGQKKT
jgi:hypothetical protein